MTQDILELADEYAHCYAFVGDETMPIKRKQLHDAIAAIQAQESEKWQARVAELEEVLTYLIHASLTDDRREYKLMSELTELRTEHADLIKMRSALLDLYDKQEDELTELREVVRKVAEQKPIAIINRGAASELGLPQGMKIYAAPQMQKEGYDLFPVEPSDKMKDAGYAQSNDESKVMCGLIYKAMIAASKEEKR